MKEDKIDLIIRILESAKEHNIASEIKDEVECIKLLYSKGLLKESDTSSRNINYKITNLGIEYLIKFKDVQEIMRTK